MNPEDLQAFFIEIRKELILKKTEIFEPSEYHIFLSLDISKGGDPVSYMDYDPRKKEIQGIEKTLLPKLETFMRITNNHFMIQKIKKYLQ